MIHWIPVLQPSIYKDFIAPQRQLFEDRLTKLAKITVKYFCARQTKVRMHKTTDYISGILQYFTLT